MTTHKIKETYSYTHKGITIYSANPVGSKELQAIFKEHGMESEYKPASRVNRLESEV